MNTYSIILNSIHNKYFKIAFGTRSPEIFVQQCFSIVAISYWYLKQ